MLRYSLFLLAVLATAATAIAAISPQDPTGGQVKNVTVIEKNQAFPLIGPLIVEDCVTENCAPDQV
ncbi:MAG: hypothetical protein KDK75_17750 [Alphaproteobacteria bacterium]|nr:hypothetical protein [Alphaproteobacteria bacterium]